MPCQQGEHLPHTTTHISTQSACLQGKKGPQGRHCTPLALALRPPRRMPGLGSLMGDVLRRSSAALQEQGSSKKVSRNAWNSWRTCRGEGEEQGPSKG